MRLYRLVIVLSILLFIKVGAQSTITLDEAIKMALQNNIELKKYEAEVKGAESELNASSRFPNPRFLYSREDLSDQQIDFSEWTAMGSLPINFLWERWNNIDSKEYYWKAQKLLLGNYKLSLISNVQKGYVALHYQTKLYNSITKVQNKLDKLVESANHRFNKGDISEYELQRIIVELNKVNSLLADQEIKTLELSNNLKLLAGIESGEKLKTISPQINHKNDIGEEMFLNIAFENRNDLKAYQLLLESQKSKLSLNQSKILPEINIAAGYKKQSDNLSGSVIEVGFDLPLFERNQTQIEKSEIELFVLQGKYLFLKEKVSSEIKKAYKQIELQGVLLENISKQEYKNMFTSAALSYEYGEISLIEFLDGINAYIDGVMLENNITTNYFSSFFELQKALGKSLTNIDKN